MLIGAMNHPQADVIEEIQWMAEMGLGFLDLTLEPPAATPERIEVPAVADALDRHHMAVVGHTAHYLPIASPIESVRRGAMTELRRCLEVFAELGAEWVNVHPDPKMPMYSRKEMVARNLESLKELQDDATRLGVGLMVENISGHFNTVDQLGELLEPMPELALHLDIGHSNLEVPQNTADDLIRTFKDRLEHVHLHDNKGGSADLHLPLGTGSVDYCGHMVTLKEAGYDHTITLEVFSPDPHHFKYSRDMLRKAWEAAG